MFYIIVLLYNQVLPQVNGDRKRMISVKFILRQIFRILYMYTTFKIKENIKIL